MAPVPMGQLDETVRRRLNEWVEASHGKVTQEALSAAVGKKQSYAQRYLDGTIRRVELQTLQAWAKCFERTLPELLSLSENPEENEVLERWRMLTPALREHALALLTGLTTPRTR